MASWERNVFEAQGVRYFFNGDGLFVEDRSGQPILAGPPGRWRYLGSHDSLESAKRVVEKRPPIRRDG